jgi:uncharacterized protein
VPKTRHEPVRTCVACRRPGAQQELARFHRDAGGLILPDAGGPPRGRGAYLHATGECAGQARRRRALERALRGELSDEASAWLRGQEEART